MRIPAPVFILLQVDLGWTNMDINNWNTINLWEKSCRYFHSSGNQTECMIMISKKSVFLIIFNYIHFPIHPPEPVSGFKFIFPSNVIEFILRIVIKNSGKIYIITMSFISLLSVNNTTLYNNDKYQQKNITVTWYVFCVYINKE